MKYPKQVECPLPGLEIKTDGTLHITASATSSAHDFDFLTGEHVVHHRKLKERLSHHDEWMAFEGGHEMKKILDGKGNIEKYELTALDGEVFEGMNLRLFDPLTRLWHIYWADSIDGRLSLPVVGSFLNGIGHFYARDTFLDKAIIILFCYDSVTDSDPTWSQAFSADGGKTWEWNWQMVYR